MPFACACDGDGSKAQWRLCGNMGFVVPPCLHGPGIGGRMNAGLAHAENVTAEGGSRVRPAAAEISSVMSEERAAAKVRKRVVIPHQTRPAACILTVTFIHAHWRERGGEGRHGYSPPSSVCQWCGWYQLMFRSAQGLCFISAARHIDRTSVAQRSSGFFSCTFGREHPIRRLQSRMGHEISREEEEEEEAEEEEAEREGSGLSCGTNRYLWNPRLEYKIQPGVHSLPPEEENVAGSPETSKRRE
ncbi:unnamed protein product [Pleuronectes platessa]|uniref:Uncharacterized protein n=1 Tax=Pleuronectes platessa TaxID=8262 RepID=A0A9N7Z1I5_PLEPL|nr:unnamed protein product [Pleuronectes platessa]